jgi:hypothetical protein
MPPNGAILWEGPGPDGAPLAAVATGLVVPSSNPKTGPMVQTWLMRSDMHPVEAMTTGADVATCNGCELRPFLVRMLPLKPGKKPPQCYVNMGMALNQVWKKLISNHYPRVEREDIPLLFAGKSVRIGSFGNFSNAPEWLVPTILQQVSRWTMYEHNWQDALIPMHLALYSMASVSSPDNKVRANALGWRTFRVKRPEEPVMRDEIVCPASDEAGKRTTCDRCRLCRGNSIKAKNVVIDDHGPTSPATTKKQRAGALLGLGLDRLHSPVRKTS